MNPKDIAKFVESLSKEQRAQFEAVFKTVGESMEVEVKQEELKQDVPVNNVNEDFRVTNSRSEIEKGRKPVRARKNRWEDTGEWKLPEGEEEWGDRKRASRSRANAKKVKLECSVCGKKFMESQNLVYGEHHRCNRCGSK